MRTNAKTVAALVSPSSLERYSYAADIRPKIMYSGLLVSSLNTVSLDPVPYISFNITKSSSTLRTIDATSSFTLTGVLSEETAHAFSRKTAPMHGGTPGVRQAQWRSLPEIRNPKAWDQWRHWIGEQGEVRRDRGGTWWLRCEYRRDFRMDVGDHAIIVGQVVDAGWSTIGPENSELDSTLPGNSLSRWRNALLYHNGLYYPFIAKPKGWIPPNYKSVKVGGETTADSSNLAGRAEEEEVGIEDKMARTTEKDTTVNKDDIPMGDKETGNEAEVHYEQEKRVPRGLSWKMAK